MTIYVATCPPPEGGVLGFMGAMDRAPGEATCAAMLDSARRAARMVPDIDVVSYAFSDPGVGLVRRFPEIEPDRDAEASHHSLYRVVLTPPRSSRTTTTGGSYVSTSMEFEVTEVATEKVLGRSTLVPVSAGRLGADQLVSRLIAGLKGNRCEVLNKWSLSGIAHKAASGKSCDTYTLWPVD
ncbi:hypothetical protein [Luteibacter sp.]|uniref:hypothetical protein n=1 Tax=Luteibacter sp. TaxID=1886636 RepID=UPI0025C53BAA|nr:hypothetical protein [Luteibacter sp.]